MMRYRARDHQALLIARITGAGLAGTFSRSADPAALAPWPQPARMLVADDYPFGWLAEKYERFLAAFEDA
jgi:hypothetical protein